jgi:hypothetical protein
VVTPQEKRSIIAVRLLFSVSRATDKIVINLRRKTKPSESIKRIVFSKNSPDAKEDSDPDNRAVLGP